MEPAARTSFLSLFAAGRPAVAPSPRAAAPHPTRGPQPRLPVAGAAAQARTGSATGATSSLGRDTLMGGRGAKFSAPALGFPLCRVARQDARRSHALGVLGRRQARFGSSRYESFGVRGPAGGGSHGDRPKVCTAARVVTLKAARCSSRAARHSARHVGGGSSRDGPSRLGW
jgi:hypothetical protein